MEDIRDIQDLKHKKSFKSGLLLFSTIFIISASALLYASMVYEKALDVGSTSGVTTGSGSTVPVEVSFTPAAIMMLAVAGVVVGLSLFGFLRKASKRFSNTPGGRGSSPTGPVSMSLEVPGIGLPLNLPSTEGEEWEESPAKEEPSASSG
jgi:hypothetical protein